MNPFSAKKPASLSAPGKKKPVVEETTLVVSKPDVPKPATEQGEVVISPEMVCFRTEDEVCRLCKHYGQDGYCAVLKMNTAPQDGCNAFREREDGASDIEDASDIGDPNEAMEREVA